MGVSDKPKNHPDKNHWWNTRPELHDIRVSVKNSDLMFKLQDKYTKALKEDDSMPQKNKKMNKNWKKM